mmetsp:Transcript_50947/g.99679  ORF Transcript_50947/g.99679 Transcript_50947/m.99679 type:complete len:107 (-) Transcript_50947:266-586(-)
MFGALDLVVAGAEDGTDDGAEDDANDGAEGLTVAVSLSIDRKSSNILSKPSILVTISGAPRTRRRGLCDRIIDDPGGTMPWTKDGKDGSTRSSNWMKINSAGDRLG